MRLDPSSGFLSWSPLLLGGASWLLLFVYLGVMFFPGFDPGAPSLSRALFFAAAGGAFLMSPLAVVMGALFVWRGINRKAAIAGLLLGLPLTLLFGWAMFVVVRHGGV